MTFVRVLAAVCAGAAEKGAGARSVFLDGQRTLEVVDLMARFLDFYARARNLSRGLAGGGRVAETTYDIAADRPHSLGGHAPRRRCCDRTHPRHVRRCTVRFQARTIVETEAGVFQPAPLGLEIGLFAAALLFVAVSAALGRIPGALTWIYGAFLLTRIAYRLYEYRRYGRLGPPTVAIADGILILSRPSDSRGALRLPLQDLQELIIYGRTGQLTYRFVEHDGGHVEATPAWGRRVEESVLRFLQQALPGKVTVAPPQTLFASIRGDGP
jgi:hypothetical protein